MIYSLLQSRRCLFEIGHKTQLSLFLHCEMKIWLDSKPIKNRTRSQDIAHVCFTSMLCVLGNRDDELDKSSLDDVFVKDGDTLAAYVCSSCSPYLRFDDSSIGGDILKYWSTIPRVQGDVKMPSADSGASEEDVAQTFYTSKDETPRRIARPLGESNGNLRGSCGGV